MYLHLGQSVVTAYQDVIGIFDLDNASWSHRTRAFLERAEREGRVVNAAADIPRSFILIKKGQQKPIIYLSQFSSATLKGRIETGGF